MDSNHDIVPTLRLNGGVYMSFAADEIERLRARVALLERRADTSLIPGAEPTHRCKVCGAYWRKWNVDGESSWNLCSRGCGECCDNAAMGDQIEALASPAKVGVDGLIEQHARDSAELRRLCAARDEARRTAEYWKANHLAGNAEIERLKKLLEAKVGGDEREAFEAWFEADAMPGEADWFKRETDEPDEYAYTSTHNAWKAWQARAALSADGGEDKRNAERYRIARRKVCIVGDEFHIINIRPTYVAPDAAVEFDAVVDAIAANQAKGDAS